MSVQSPHPARERVQQLPQCAGVYYFYAANGALLYVGKSVNLRQRVASHFSPSETHPRHRRMMRETARIEHHESAGEIGALLLENREIKQRQPLYNRALRRQRGLWTLQLRAGERHFWQVYPVPLHDAQLDPALDHYGVFGTRAKALDFVRELCRQQGLCPQCLGLSKGRGACFDYALKRCRGACAGLESVASHNRRLCQRLGERSVRAWPHSGAMWIRESDPKDPHRVDWHWVDHWHYVGSYLSPQLAPSEAPNTRGFDQDSYRILQTALEHPHCQWIAHTG